MTPLAWAFVGALAGVLGYHLVSVWLALRSYNRAQCLHCQRYIDTDTQEGACPHRKKRAP